MKLAQWPMWLAYLALVRICNNTFWQHPVQASTMQVMSRQIAGMNCHTLHSSLSASRLCLA